ncbi:MAG: hypothetical protein KGI54_10380 [Pseudomonadota bacterium]|nr:hypothetical protein [Pseudomonadota bacterium]
MAQATRKAVGKSAAKKAVQPVPNKIGQVTKKTDLVSYVVASGRSVVHGVERLASGDEVHNMEAQEIARLFGLGFLVKKTTSVPSIEGPSLSPSDGPTVKAGTQASAQSTETEPIDSETGAQSTTTSEAASGNADTQASSQTVES